MPKLIELLIFEHRNEHSLPIKKPYSVPKIYTANGDIKKRWFVYYNFITRRSPVQFWITLLINQGLRC
jgi:hypothetical protein